MRLKQKNEIRARDKMDHAQFEEMKAQEQKDNLLKQKQEREFEKKKIKDAIFLHKKEEAKQAKFIGQQNKQRYYQYSNQ